jgi:NAD(P)-dependent dehydrogenase (short-subunit alcohol dehydrogenase family)
LNGKGIVLGLAQSGADVVVTDLSYEVFNVAKEIESIGSEAFPVKCDVTDLKEAQIIGKNSRQARTHRHFGEQRWNLFPRNHFLK